MMLGSKFFFLGSLGKVYYIYISIASVSAV